MPGEINIAVHADQSTAALGDRECGLQADTRTSAKHDYGPAVEAGERGIVGHTARVAPSGRTVTDWHWLPTPDCFSCAAATQEPPLSILRAGSGILVAVP
jgi:hypothetical protein